MATSFPTSLDTLTNPTSTDTLDSATVPHDLQHTNANDAIEALQAKVGINGSADTNSLDYKANLKSLLAEYIVTGSAVTSIDFSGLDINTHKSYRVEIELVNPTATAFSLQCFVNNDTTLTNYRSVSLVCSGTTATVSSVSDARLVVVDSSVIASTVSFISLVNGYAKSNSVSSRGTNSQSTHQITATKTTTVSNITQLTLTSSIASTIGVGSKIRIYRGDV